MNPKHPRPVGKNCKINATNPEVQGDQSEVDPMEDAEVTPPPQGEEGALAMILKKIKALEDQNKDIVQRLDDSRSTRTSIRHSSPKKSHACSQKCSSEVDNSDLDESVLPDARFLRENEVLQGRVQDQLRRLHGKQRDTGTVKFKSGLLRVNDSRKKLEIP